MARICRKCGESKGCSEFYTHKNSSLYLDCKPCWRAYVKLNREDKADYYRMHDLLRVDDPKRKEARTAYRKSISTWRRYKYNLKYNLKDTSKGEARGIFARAIRSGKIDRPSSCSVCGTECTPHGHHEDYSKPLDVIWVCNPCHGHIHRMPRLVP